VKLADAVRLARSGKTKDILRDKVKLADAIRLARSVKVSHAQNFARHVVPEVVRPARVIWNQAIGALFVLLAVPAIFKAVEISHGLGTDPKAPFAFGLSLVFAAVMAFFAVNSFLKARRVARRL
jgi:dipeptide/tripeptide permease